MGQNRGYSRMAEESLWKNVLVRRRCGRKLGEENNSFRPGSCALSFTLLHSPLIVSQPPTLTTVLEGWSVASSAGTLTERQRFLKTHLNEIDNVLEILLRLVRGDRTAPLALSAQMPAPTLTGPLLSALVPGSAHAAQQTPISLAVLAMFRMTVEYADKAAGEKGKADVEERVGEIIRCLPPSQIHKSLDAIFKEWKVDKKR